MINQNITIEKKKLLGSGYFGKVFESHYSILNKEIALKVLDKDKVSLNDFENEYKAMNILENENIVKFYGKFEDKENYYLIMEKCDSNLYDYIKNKKGLTVEEIRIIIKQLNKAFKLMNEKCIIHRDIKPNNILINYKNKKSVVVKLSDFGTIKMLMSSLRASTQVGTNGFMAPEIRKLQNKDYSENEEKKYYTNKADLWSIGVMLIYMFFNNIDEIKLYNGILPDIEKIKDDNLKDLIKQLVVIEPEKRINWENYFNHPFFDDNEKKIKKLTEENELLKKRIFNYLN
jgi:serine/threonine protein kinase